MQFHRAAFLGLPLALSATASATIDYRVTALPTEKRVKIDITIPVVGQETSLQLPRWAPGAYVLRGPTNTLEDLSVTDAKGRKVGILNAYDNTWRVPGMNAGKITVSYTMPRPEADAFNLSGPSIYLYVVGRKTEDCTLTIDVPKDWKTAVGLTGEGPVYKAKTYDVLADNPITLGKFREVRYSALGKPHVIAVYGASKDKVDLKQVAGICKKVTEAEAALMGGLPYDKYVWHFNVSAGADWAGGLEHLSSTQISYGETIGNRTKSVYAHEFFHLWNVKRIRSFPLGPFDYTQLPKTGALWWLEGVTDYYAGAILCRSGQYTDAEYIENILDSLRTQRANANRLTTSADEASRRVGDAAGGRGNSIGYQISYYDTGYLIGLCLDLEIIERTHGKYSLDDVLHALWQQCRDDQPGFREDEIKKQVLRFGGPEMGPIYTALVEKGGELPVETALAKAGWILAQRPKDVPTLGFATKSDGDKVFVGTVENAASELKEGDELILARGELNRLRRALVVGQPIELKVRRNGQELTVKHPTSKIQQVTWTIEPVASPTPEQLKIRKKWLSLKR